MSDDKNILVVGGSGFIGSAFLRCTQGTWGQNTSVRALTRNVLRSGTYTNGAAWEVGNLVEGLGKPRMRCDGLVYICGQNRGPGYDGDRDLRCAENMCKYAEGAATRNCVLISSGAVSQPADEGESPWITAYRDTKGMIERMFSGTFENLIILRVYTLVGPRMPKAFALRQFIETAMDRQPIRVLRPSYNTTFLHTFDLAHYIKYSLNMCMEYAKSRTYEVGGGKLNSMSGCAYLVSEIFNGFAGVITEPDSVPTVYHRNTFPLLPTIDLRGALLMLKTYGLDT